MGKGRGKGRGRGRSRAAATGTAEIKPGIKTDEDKQQRPGPNRIGGQKNDVSEASSSANSVKCQFEKSSRSVLDEKAEERVNEAVEHIDNCKSAASTAVSERAKQAKNDDGRGSLVVKNESAMAEKNLEESCSPSEGANAVKIAPREKQSVVEPKREAEKLADQVQAMSININKTGSSSASTRLRNNEANTQLLKRPNFGSNGRKIKLKANFVRMAIPAYGDIFHYDVTIVPDKCPRKVNQEVIAKMVDLYQKVFQRQRPVFDGKKNLYSKDPLPIGNNPKEFIVTIKDEMKSRDREFKVTIKQVARVSLETLNNGLKGKTEIPKDTIQALEVVLRMAPTARYIPVGRSFFSEPEPGTAIPLGNGCEIWYGSYQSTRPTQWGMLVNIDQATTAFYKSQPVIDYLKEILPGCNLNQRLVLRDTERIQFQKKIKGFKVQFTYIAGQKRQKRIIGVSKESAEDIKFEMETDGRKKKISVAQYFLEKYKIKLRFPNLQCLKAGSDQNVIHLPIEVCTIVPGQRCMKKLDEKQTSLMIRETAKDAMDRRRKIEARVAEANFDEDPFLRDFGMRVSKELVSVEGRVLQPPKIQLDKESRLVIPRDGKWDMRGAAFYEGRKIDCWGIIVCAQEGYCNERALRTFCSDLNKVSSSLNMAINENPSYVKYLSRSWTLNQLFEDIIKVSGLQLVLVILDGGLYAEVKSLADTSFGILTQCIKSKNVTRPNPQLLANLCMKINAKMNGVNGFFEKVYRPRKVFEKPVIFLGADVTHPSPGDTTKPSVAAVVGSIDSFPMRYAARVRAQAHRKEIISDLTLMTKELLIEFNKAIHHQPAKIIMYRDGVSEGQFSQVLHFELEAVRQACRELPGTYRPAITFITVQKRHHVRLFAEENRDQVGKSRNIPAGTVVDRAICHPSEFDFYLCSHNGIQGTSRPSHYRVLWDDSGFTADELQQLTYGLCHNYARCTRSVSIPPPAYYAHHVAMRANYHIQAMESSSNGSSNESQTGSINLDAVNNNLESAIKVHQNLLSTMYFI